MIKQTGDWQCGGRTHDDHSEMFESLFFHDVDELSLQLHTKSGIDEQAARVMLCQLFQVKYIRICSGVYMLLMLITRIILLFVLFFSSR